MSARQPLMPMKYYERHARRVWAPFFNEDADDSNHRLGWGGLVFMAKKLGVSPVGHQWNSHASKRRLAKKLLAAKLSETRREWSQKISTGLYEVFEDATPASGFKL